MEATSNTSGKGAATPASADTQPTAAAASARVAYVYDARMLKHRTTPFHPETAKRIRAIHELLLPRLTRPKATPVAELAPSQVEPGLTWVTCPKVQPEHVLLCHGQAHVDRLQQVAHDLATLTRTKPKSGPHGVSLDADTHMSVHSLEAAQLAAGGVVHVSQLVKGGTHGSGSGGDDGGDAADAAVDSALDAAVDTLTALSLTESQDTASPAVPWSHALAIVRPPGHHACANRAMGFCLFNNVAIAAVEALHRGAAKRVAIVDWDVHHGNGTQDLLESNPNILYISLHRHENGSFYPGTGGSALVGPHSTCANVAWNGSQTVGDLAYAFAFRHVVMPLLRAFAPDLLFVSSGFDAARGDPLGGNDVTPAGYYAMAHDLVGLGVPVVVAMEGGYKPDANARSCHAVVDALLGLPYGPLPAPSVEQDQPLTVQCVHDVHDTLKALVSAWPALQCELDQVATVLQHMLAQLGAASGEKKVLTQQRDLMSPTH